MAQSFPLYITLTEFKNAVSIPDGLTDDDATRAIGAASRAIEKLTGRKFFKTAEETRRFTPVSPRLVITSDIASITTVSVDGTEWATNEWYAGPDNAIENEEPYLWIDALGAMDFVMEPGSVSITGEFGWPEIPYQVEQMTAILASKLFKRTREAPWGIVTTGTVEGLSIRIVRDDPDAKLLTEGLRRAETYSG